MADHQAVQSVELHYQLYHQFYESMNESAALHELIYDENAQPIDYRILDVNPAYERITGISREQAVGNPASAVYGTGEAPYLAEYVRVMQSGEPAAFCTYYKPMHKYFDISVFSPREGQFATIARDITNQVRSDNQLRAMAETWEMTFNSIPDPISIQDSHFQIIRVNQAYADLLGSSSREICGRTCHEIVHGLDAPWPDCPVTEALKKRTAVTREYFEPNLQRHIQVSASPLIDERGQISGIVHVIKDVTRRVNGENQIKAQRDRAKMYFDIAAVIMLVIDSNGIVTEINQKGCEILGYTEDEIVGSNWMEKCVPAAVRDDVMNTAGRLLKGIGTEAVEYFENPIVTQSGEERLIAWHNTVLRDENGDIIATLSSGEDITERRKSLNILRESEARYRNLFEQSYDAIIVRGAAGTILDVNQTACTMLQYTRGELIGKKAQDLLTESGRISAKKGFQAASDKGAVQLESEFVRKDGTVLDVDVRAQVIDPEKGIVQSIIRDISQRKAKDRELAKTLKQLNRNNLVQEALLQGTRSILACNTFSEAARALFDQCCKVTGAQSGYVALLSDDGMENEVLFLEAGGMPCSVDPSLPMPIRGLREKAYVSGRAVFENDFDNSEWMKFMPAGHVFLKNVMFAPLNIQGKTAGIMGLANKESDFSTADAEVAEAFGDLAAIALSASRATEALKTSEENYRGIVEYAVTGIAQLNLDGRVLECNNAFAEILGYSLEELQETDLISITHPEDSEADKQQLQDLLQGTTNMYQLEKRFIHKSGNEIWVKVMVSLIRDSDGNPKSAIKLIDNITLQKKAEQQLIKEKNNLDRFVKLAVGREKKMIELKGRIKELEEQLSQSESESQS